MSVTRAQIETALKQYVDPYLEKDLIAANSVKNIVVDGGKVSVDVQLGFPAAGYRDTLSAKLKELIKTVAGVTDMTVNVTSNIVTHTVQKGVKPITGVKNIIAVASGKGGVGKSTVAVNLALALSVEGARVGILDADIYGPSQPRMLGVMNSKPESSDGRSLDPVVSYNLQIMSIGFLVDQDTPMIWRGPMVTQALTQLLNDTHWNELDYLVIDLPPGTGDIQLTLAQKVPVTGVVIVTTPQDIALLDARKGLKRFEKVGVPIIGIVENMAMHVCTHCGHMEHIFGAGGGEKMARDYDIELLGSLPLDMKIREMADGGKPTVVSEPDGPIAGIYKDIARKCAAKIAKQSQHRSSVFPKKIGRANV